MKLFRKWQSGYRGAIGFKNLAAEEIIAAEIRGFSKPVSTGSLIEGEHSFSFLGRQELPQRVTVTWSMVGDNEPRIRELTLDSVSPEARDGAIFFVHGGGGDWKVEFLADFDPLNP